MLLVRGEPAQRHAAHWNQSSARSETTTGTVACGIGWAVRRSGLRIPSLRVEQVEQFVRRRLARLNRTGVAHGKDHLWYRHIAASAGPAYSLQVVFGAVCARVLQPGRGGTEVVG